MLKQPHRFWACFFVLACYSGAVIAAPVSLTTAIQQGLDHDPSQALQAIDLQIAETAIQQSQGQLDSQLSLSLNTSQDQSPNTSIFAPLSTQSSSAVARLQKPLQEGGDITVSTQFSRLFQQLDPAFPSANINPAYRGQIDISYRLPLLQDYQRPSYSLNINIAKAGVQRQCLLQQSNARQLSLRIINEYYNLLLDDAQIKTSQQAIQRSKKLIRYHRSREHIGLSDGADLVQAEVQLANTQETLEKLQAQRRLDESILNQSMLQAEQAPLEVQTPKLPKLDLQQPLTYWLKLAEQQRPEFQQLKARLQQAQAQLALAQNQGQDRLDLTAQLGTRSLSNQALASIQASLGPKHYYAAIGLEYSQNIEKHAQKAAILKAELTQERLNIEYQQLSQQLRLAISKTWNQLHTGISVLQQMKQHEQAVQEKVRTEIQRYREGRSSSAVVILFENERIQTQMNTHMQSLKLQLYHLQLLWQVGQLHQTLKLNIGSCP